MTPSVGDAAPGSEPAKDAADGAKSSQQEQQHQQEHHGHGAKLHEIPWQLPLGPVASMGTGADELLREQLLARHLDAVSDGALSEETLEACRGKRNWRKRAFREYGELVKAREGEKALDVAR